MMKLIDRIECGMTTEDDARFFSWLVAQLAGYEAALRHISNYCDGEAAALAAKALAKAGHEPARSA